MARPSTAWFRECIVDGSMDWGMEPPADSRETGFRGSRAAVLPATGAGELGREQDGAACCVGRGQEPTEKERVRVLCHVVLLTSSSGRARRGRLLRAETYQPKSGAASAVIHTSGCGSNPLKQAT